MCSERGGELECVCVLRERERWRCGVCMCSEREREVECICVVR